MNDNVAKVNITISGNNGDLLEPVPFSATDAEIKSWVTEAVLNGSVPGIPATPNVDLSDFVVDRFSPTEARPYSLIILRPKTPFGQISEIIG